MGIKMINVQVTDEMHLALKMKLLKDGKTMKDFLTTKIEEYITEKKEIKKGGK